MDFAKINWGTIQRYTSSQSVKDFDEFLDDLPLNVGNNALIAAGLVCVMAGASVWFASMETEKVSKLHSELMNVQALQPPVPVLKYTPVSQVTLKKLSDKVAATYKGITLTSGSDGVIGISAGDTDYFPQFLAAISYLQRGGRNWKVRIESLCAGRECPSSKLTATLKVEAVRFGEPEAVDPAKAAGDKEVKK
jgi:hypothetical protein